jgi:hypothetical protein
VDIKVEISMTPEELRRFLGLPDVGGLQDDLIDFLRSKMGAAGDVAADFDATDFVRSNFDTLRKAPGKGFDTIMKRVRPESAKSEDAPKKRGSAGPRRSRAKKS